MGSAARRSTNGRPVWWPGRIRSSTPQGPGRRECELKNLLAEAMLDNAMLKDLNSKNGNARPLSGTRVGRELDAVIARRGCPTMIVSDNVAHWEDARPVGLSQRRRDRLLETRKANGQCVLRGLQRSRPGGVTEYLMVPVNGRRYRTDRGMEVPLQQ